MSEYYKNERVIKFHEKQLETLYGKLDKLKQDKEWYGLDTDKEYKSISDKIIQTKSIIENLENSGEGIRMCFGCIPDDERAIIDMKYKEKLSLYQISIGVNMSISTASRWLHKAVNRLYETIENTCPVLNTSRVIKDTDRE